MRYGYRVPDTDWRDMATDYLHVHKSPPRLMRKAEHGRL